MFFFMFLDHSPMKKMMEWSTTMKNDSDEIYWRDYVSNAHISFVEYTSESISKSTPVHKIRNSILLT